MVGFYFISKVIFGFSGYTEKWDGGDALSPKHNPKGETKEQNFMWSRVPWLSFPLDQL